MPVLLQRVIQSRCKCAHAVDIEEYNRVGRVLKRFLLACPKLRNSLEWSQEFIGIVQLVKPVYVMIHLNIFPIFFNHSAKFWLQQKFADSSHYMIFYLF